MKTIKGKKSIRGFDGPAALWAAAAAAARVLAFVLAGVVILAGCPTPDGGGDPDPTVTGVTVTADAAFVVKGGTLQFHATVAGENSPSQAVTWSVTTGGAASGTGISEAGLLTVDADESRTSLEIKAVSQQDGVTFGTKTVSVVTPNTGEIVSVTVTGTAAVGQVLTVEAKDSNGAAVTDAVFQWKRADASDGTYTDIPNATSAAYTLKTADTGKYLKAEASNAATATAVLSDAQGPVTLPASETPTASVTRVAKTSAAQAAVDFTLTNATALSGTWKVYSAAGGDTLASGVTAAVTTWPTLRLSHSSNIPAAVYYVTVTEAGKAESARLALTVGNIASSATVSTLASVLEALPANTAETP
ncbi:MAG: hypothetical protein LBR16_06390, partial [Treponema sp.]|nr:hypothetical protein [Treponema sp.]